MQDYIRRILTSRVYDVAVESPLDPMPRLSERLGRAVRLKREDLQPVFSFKLRGAYNKMAGLDEEALRRGVICASAGNHAQGVAMAAEKLGTKAVIVMPRTAPAIKVQAVKRRGAKVVLHGDSFDEAYGHARALEAEKGLTFIHPYDDPDVIAGQATVGLEILRQHPGPIEAIFVQIGGGGLAAGIASCVKFLRPDIRIIGVEPEDAASMAAAIASGERVALDQVGAFADGVAVRQAGTETFRICQNLLDEVITVSTDEICAAIKDVFDDTRAVSEPAGALGLAGLKRYAERGGAGTGGAGSGKGALLAVNSGANMNFDRLRHVAERAQIGEGREAIFAVTIPEQPGAYRRFVQALGRHAVTEFNYRYSDPKQARIFVGVEVGEGGDGKQKLFDGLRAEGYGVVDMSDNEMAKVHVRYMVGGCVAGLENELVYRFQFPERPGALLKFLNDMSPDWSITMFHYRNHGADYGRVLAGVQVPPKDRGKFRRYLDRLGYPWWDETDNPAYRFFLQAGG